MQGFLGCHSEWNLGSPGGWDYQRITQIIGKEVWQRLNDISSIPLALDFDHPLLFPVYGFVDMLVREHRAREGSKPGLIAVVAEEETLQDVTENRNLAEHLGRAEGISGALMAPQELELVRGRVCWRGEPVSVIFVDFNSDVLLALHRKHNLSPLLQAVRERRVINPRGTGPINAKSMFEVVTGPQRDRFHEETVRRTPWTRQFYPRRTSGPGNEEIPELVEWTRSHWANLVLKPERGYSGRGVRVGTVHTDPDEAVDLALKEGNYIVQEKIPLNLWAEEIPVPGNGRLNLVRQQTDFRCLLGPQGLLGFLGRFGGVPTNVGSGGGVQPLAILRSQLEVREAVAWINDALLAMDFGEIMEVVEMQKDMAVQHHFTYLLGPIKIALRPRLITEQHLEALERYALGLWSDCLTLERMWLDGELAGVVKIDDEEVEIARWQPWRGSSALIASDGLFSFGAHPEPS